MVLAVVAMEEKAPRWVLFALFFPFFFGAFGVFQGLLRTCPGLALRGMRDAGDGPEKIADAGERRPNAAPRPPRGPCPPSSPAPPA